MRINDTWSTALVRCIKDLTPSVREFELVPEDGALPPYSPGSHLNVRVQIDGRQETRSYSLTGAPGTGSLRIAVKRLDAGRGGSRYMWSLQPGARLAISAPANHFELDHTAPQVLLVAGGIGVTPLVGMARTLAARGVDVAMRYAVRNADELAYEDTLRAALGERLRTLLSDGGRHLDFAAEFAALHPGAQVYLCGPVPMMDAARTAWAAAGRPLEDLRFETFGSSGRHAPQAFEIRLPRYAMALRVERDRSVLDTLEACGIEVLSDCRRGECGLCAMDVLAVDGEIDHRDVFLSEHEKRDNKRICVCVSRVVGRGITLDSAYRPD